jgi:putative endopeptidase
MKLKHTLMAGAVLLAIASCGNEKGTEGNTGGKAARKLLDPANIDSSIRPGENFYMYANNGWLKKNLIPGDQTRWGSFNELQENNYKALHELLEDAGKKNAAAGTTDQKVGDLYKAGMDSSAIEKAGITPLNEHFARINAITDATGVMNEVALEHTLGLNALFNFYVSPDDKQVTKQISQLFQGGLGMPDRDYYFKTDEPTTKIREAYKQYLVTLFKLMGSDSTTAQKDAADVFKLETALAGASMTRVEMRDPYKLYNKYNTEGLNKQTPGIDWKSVFTGLKINGQDSMIVGQPKFFAEISRQLKATPIPVWKKYLQVQMAMDMSPYLSSTFDNAHFDFFGRTMRGQQAQKPRWQRVLNVVDGSVGELLGQMYVDKHFKPDAKKRMLDLVNNLQQTYADRIRRLTWMSEPTKQKALAKLNTFMKKIGYPDKWKDYSSLTIAKGNYVKNIMNASAFEYNYNVSKLGKPVDRTEWGMTPPTVNAYYNPAFNEIVFPAGILQYPFFSDDADDAVNYGGIGGVIGHEMTHGFDDQGRQYDADGNLHDWWTPEDAKNFLAKAGMVITQYNNYTVLDTVHVNGELTQGENLADLGGINIAYEAFKKTKQGKSNEKIDGFTPDQRFFLSWAQVWRAATRPEEMRNRIVTDPHSPNELRCNGPVSNMPEFYAAFGIKPGDKMYRADSIRASVW